MASTGHIPMFKTLQSFEIELESNTKHTIDNLIVEPLIMLLYS